MKMFLHDSLAPGAKRAVIERSAHIEADVSGALEEMGIAERALARPQLRNKLEGFLYLADGHGLGKVSNDAHPRLEGVDGRSSTHGLDRLLHRTSAQGN